MERPLLIYNTKFDIRQWFLIACAVPLTIWIYKECYIRFSSQLFTLNKLHESVHLTNNSVQSRYENCIRNAALPQCNMWDSTQFKKYLASIGHPKVFAEVIYPGMKECLTGAILMNQDNLDTRKNCFELYGSDFMLTEDFQPWLIEINSSPALYASTPITARMCPQVLDDLIKVIIDYPKNPKATTGRFELLYKETIHKLPKVQPEILRLEGEELPTCYFYTPELHDDKMQSSISPNIEKDCTHRNIHEISSEMKTTLENLLSLIQSERERRAQLRNQSSQVSQVMEFCSNKKHKSDTDTKYLTKSLPKILNTETCNCDDATLKMIKSVAINLKMAEISISNLTTTKSKELTEAESREILNIIPNSDESIKENLVVRTNTPKGLFQNVITSIRNLSIAYRST